MSIRVLQWNCRSVIAALTDLKCLIDTQCPDIILLQETWLAIGKPFTLPDFRLFRLDRTTRGGGLLILVSQKFCHKAKLSFQFLSADCELLAIDICLPGCLSFSLVNVYFPNGVCTTDPLDLALSSSNQNVVIAGDFNSHHVSWGFKSDSCGWRLLDWTVENNLLCFNSGSATFFRSQVRSVLDLTFAKGRLVSSWNTVDCPTSSDHVPIVFEIAVFPSTPKRVVRTLVNYEIMKKTLRSSLTSLPYDSMEIRAVDVTALLKRSLKTRNLLFLQLRGTV